MKSAIQKLEDKLAISREKMDKYDKILLSGTLITITVAYILIILGLT